jgi:branched-chain amino acid transport system ATP-binding protein
MLLEIEALESFYGRSQALFGVDFAMDEGEVVALMGRNGMGKTTTICSLCGLVRHRGGKIRFGGTDIAGLRPHKVAQLGVGLVPEGRRCFSNLSVQENLVVAMRPGAWNLARIHRLFPRLDERRSQLASTLSGGEQQMLAIGRALMTNPKLLVLDEATEGLAPVIRQEIWSAIGELKSEGQSILIVDKTIRELLKVADRCTILERGQNVWGGSPGELSEDVQDRYLGV